MNYYFWQNAITAIKYKIHNSFLGKIFQLYQIIYNHIIYDIELLFTQGHYLMDQNYSNCNPTSNIKIPSHKHQIMLASSKTYLFSHCWWDHLYLTLISSHVFCDILPLVQLIEPLTTWLRLLSFCIL